jgi:hypothetical protein
MEELNLRGEEVDPDTLGEDSLEEEIDELELD